jgi:hypothetical protein
MMEGDLAQQRPEVVRCTRASTGADLPEFALRRYPRDRWAPRRSITPLPQLPDEMTPYVGNDG